MQIHHIFKLGAINAMYVITGFEELLLLWLIHYSLWDMASVGFV